MSKAKPVQKMTRKEFLALPSLGWNDDPPDFDSVVILPSRRMHESGYRLLDFVACKGDRALVRLSGCSDVLHIDGIGGYGKNWLKKYGTVPTAVPASGWCIDCLPVSGLLSSVGLA